MFHISANGKKLKAINFASIFRDRVSRYLRACLESYGEIEFIKQRLLTGYSFVDLPFIF